MIPPGSSDIRLLTATEFMEKTDPSVRKAGCVVWVGVERGSRLCIGLSASQMRARKGHGSGPQVTGSACLGSGRGVSGRDWTELGDPGVCSTGVPSGGPTAGAHHAQNEGKDLKFHASRTVVTPGVTGAGSHL